MKQQVVPSVGNSGLPYKSYYVRSSKQNSLKAKKWALLVQPFSSLFGRVLFKPLDPLSQKDYFKAVLILLDLYESPLFPTLGTTCCLMN